MHREEIRGIRGAILGGCAFWLALAVVDHLGTYGRLAVRTAPVLVGLGVASALLIVALTTWRLRVLLAPDADHARTAGLAFIAAIGEVVRFAGMPMLSFVVMAGTLFAIGYRPGRLVAAIVPIALVDLLLRDGVHQALAASPVLAGVALAAIPAWRIGMGRWPGLGSARAAFDLLRRTWTLRATLHVAVASACLVVALSSAMPLAVLFVEGGAVPFTLGSSAAREEIRLPDPSGYSLAAAKSTWGVPVMVERGVILLGVLIGGMLALRRGHLPDFVRVRTASERVVLATTLALLIPIRLHLLQRMPALPYYVWDAHLHLTSIDFVLLGQLPDQPSLYHALAAIGLLVAGEWGIMVLGVLGAAAAALATYVLLRRLGAIPWVAGSAGVAVGNIPLAAYASLAAVPDGYILAFSAVGLATVVAGLQDGWRHPRVLAAPLTIAAAVLTKISGLAIAAPAVIAVILQRYRRPSRTTLAILAVVCVGLAVLAIPYAPVATSVLTRGAASGAVAPWEPTGSSAASWALTQLLLAPYADVSVVRCSVPAVTAGPGLLPLVVAAGVALGGIAWSLAVGRRRPAARVMVGPVLGIAAALILQRGPSCSASLLITTLFTAALALIAIGAWSALVRGPLEARFLVVVVIVTLAMQLVGYLGNRYAHPRHTFSAIAAGAGLAWIGWAQAVSWWSGHGDRPAGNAEVAGGHEPSRAG